MISLDVFNSIKAGAETNTRIFTPQKIVREMLDALPPEVWNSKTTFLDPAVKSGVYLVEIFNKLMETPAVINDFPDKIVRSEHILKNQLFGIAIDNFDLMIAQRNLYGHIGGDSNIRTIEKYMDMVKNKDSKFYTDTVKKEFNNMKFDVVIGNPPYQEETGGGRCGGKPIYQEFAKKAKEISEKYSSLIIPAKWYIPNKDTKDFTTWMLIENGLIAIHDFKVASSVFEGVSIGGGVCFYLIDKNVDTNKINVYTENEKTPVYRNKITAIVGEEPLFVRDNIAVNVISKLNIQSSGSVCGTCSNVSPFGLKTTFEGSIIPTSDNDLEVVKSYDNVEYIPRNQISKGIELIDKYNVITGTLNADGAGGLIKGTKKLSVINKPRLLKPKQVCTLTNIFICRYWYSDSISSIARRYEMTESNVSVTLNRLRSKLKKYLSERGYVL